MEQNNKTNRNLEEGISEDRTVRQQIAEAWFLTSKELAVLAHARGRKELFGFDFENLSGIKKEEMYEVLYKMAAKGMLKSDGISFRVEEPYRTLIDGIVKATQAVLVYPKDKEHPDLCCYEGEDDYIVTEISMVQKNSLKIYSVKKESMVVFLEEEGYLPVEKEEEYKTLLEEKKQKVPFTPARECLMEDGMKCVIEVYDLRLRQTHPLVKLVRILEEALFSFIIIHTQKESRKFSYDRQIIAEEIRHITGEELGDHDIS